MVWNIINSIVGVAGLGAALTSLYLRYRDTAVRLKTTMRVHPFPAGEAPVLEEEILDDGRKREELDVLVTFRFSNPTLNSITIDGGNIWMRLPSSEEMQQGLLILDKSVAGMNKRPPVDLKPRKAWRVQVRRSHLIHNFERMDHDEDQIKIETTVVDVLGNEHSEEFALDLDDPHYRFSEPEVESVERE